MRLTDADEESAEKYKELKKEIFTACRNEGIKIKEMPEGEEKSKHAYACRVIFRILMDCEIDAEYEKWRAENEI